MEGTKYLKAVAFMLALAGLFALMGVTCGKAHAGSCYEALVIDRAYNSDRPQVASGGDIVVVRPCGWAWGRKEKAAPFRVVSVSAEANEAEALASPLLNADGSMARERRFYFDGTTLRDRKDGAAVTPPEAKARVNADALEVHTLAPPF